MEATMLLCDYADQVNGKLYVMGGGWSVCAANQPIPVALAVKIAIPWDQANRKHAVELSLVTEDDQPVRDPEGNPILMTGKIEVGRPPGLPPGTALDAPLALRVGPLPFEPGGYVWRLSINGHPVTEVTFRALEVQSGPG